MKRTPLPKPFWEMRRTWFNTWWMLSGLRSIGRPSAKASMRSTRATMRSVSSQIRLVSSRSLSGTDCSSSWAAPRMPDSGVLTSCASMAASALTDRAALRLEIWRSMLRAIDCSVSETATRPSLSTIGDRRSAQKRLPMRGELKVTPFSATAPPLAITCSSRENSGVSSGTNSFSGWPTRRARPTPKNCSADRVGEGIMAPPSTTTTASDSESRIAVGNCSPVSSARFRGRTAISGSLPVEGGKEERGEQRAHSGGFDLAVHGSAELGRRRQALRVPAEMLARHAHAGLLAVMRKHRFEVFAHRRVLIGQRRVRQLLAGAQIMDRLIEKTRAAIGAAADHHAIGARLVERGIDVVERGDVAVGDHRQRGGGLHLADERRVGMAVIELAAGAAVHRQHPDAALLGDARQVGRVAVIGIP